MGLNGGGYTFLKAQDLPQLTDEEVQAMHTDKTTFLVRPRCKQSTQPYFVYELPPEYK